LIRRTPSTRNLRNWGKLPRSNRRKKVHQTPHSTKPRINENQLRISLRLSRRLPTIERPSRRSLRVRVLDYPTPVEISSFSLGETGCKCQGTDGWDSGSDVADVARVVACAIWEWLAGIWINADEVVVVLGLEDRESTCVFLRGCYPLRAEIRRAWGGCGLSSL
jgi:hypothetical protein